MSRIIALLFGVLGAVGAGQAPEFTQQYMQNLRGGVDRLSEVVDRFDEDAARSDMSRGEALDYCLADERPGGSMSCLGRAEDVAEYQRYREQLDLLESAGEWQRPIYLAKNPDDKVLQSTLDQYRPAVPTTMDGGGYALAGFALFWGIVSMLLGIVTAPFKRY
jgi:hypothetical protein